MVHADIRGEPAQHGRQVVVRTAMQRGFLHAPLPILVPRRLFELVLHVKQPDADRCGHQHDRQMHQQERADPDQPHQQRHDRRNGEVGRHDADPRPPAGAHQPDRQPVPQHEQIGRTDPEHHDRMPVQPIGQPAPDRQRPIFAHRQRIDVAHAAAIEIARGRVMNGMGLPPEIVRRQRQHAEHPADPVVGEPLAEEGAMPAIMLDHEQPQQEARRHHGDRPAKPTSIRNGWRPRRSPTAPQAARR